MLIESLETMSENLLTAHKQVSHLTHKLGAKNMDKDDFQRLMESYDYILRNHYVLIRFLISSLKENQCSIDEELPDLVDNYLVDKVDFAQQTINNVYEKYKKLYPLVLV